MALSELDLSDHSLRSIVAQLAHLRAAYGDVFAAPELVEPNGTYFPDAFSVDPEGIHRLLERMATYAPLSAELGLKLAFVENEPDAKAGGGCGSGACAPGDRPKEIARGTAIETEDGYAVLVNVADVAEPALLTTTLARSLGRVVLFEADEEIDPREEAALAELTAVASGFGLLLLNGACLYKKSCGGMRRHQGTVLSVEELAMALALFVRAAEVRPATVKRHLEVTQREAFELALDFVDGQPKLVEALRSAPETLEDGVFTLEEKKGFFSRLLSSKKEEPDLGASPPPARQRSEEEQRRIAEMRALVDEALQEP
jgi:hypothetical protein